MQSAPAASPAARTMCEVILKHPHAEDRFSSKKGGHFTRRRYTNACRAIKVIRRVFAWLDGGRPHPMLRPLNEFPRKIRTELMNIDLARGMKATPVASDSVLRHDWST